MSSEPAPDRARQMLKAARELLEKAEESTQKALEKAAPAVQKSVDSSIEAAAKGFNATMQSIGHATAEDQVKLLRAYRKFLGGQEDYVDARIRALEGRVRPKDERQAPPA